MTNEVSISAFFEYDAVASVATGTIFIEPLRIANLQNIAEFVAGAPIYGHQLSSQLPIIAEEIRKQQPFFAKLNAEVEKRKNDNTLTREWYERQKQSYISQNGELVKLYQMSYFETINPIDIDDERNALPDDEDRIILGFK